MSQSVDRLKELLFKPESEAIAALSDRIDAVFDRAGTTDRFQTSVAAVLDGALREAEVARHDQVATAIAPLIVKTVKTEIRNSTDDLVEALYPATGRMVQAYVASAIKDLTEEINRRLESNPLMLRINALISGRSVGELVIAGSQKLVIDDVFLIRRATGELIARWPLSSGQDSTDHVLGGVLTAINEFTSEAFKAEGSALRQIDLGGARVYLRVSPNYLLAAKCSGSAPVAAEQVFDDEFLSLMDHHGTLDGDDTATTHLREVTNRLGARLTALQGNQDRLPGGARPLPILAAIIGVPLAGWFAYSFYTDYRIERVRTLAQTVIEANSEFKGYPTDVAVTQKGHVVTLGGLAPSPAAKLSLMSQLKAVLPRTELHDNLNAVTTVSTDVRPLLADLRQQFTRRTQARAVRTIERTEALLNSTAATGDSAERADLTALAEKFAAVRADVSRDGDLSEARAKAATASLQDLARQVAARALSSAPDAPTGQTPSTTDPGDALADLAEQAAASARALATASVLKQRLAQEAARQTLETTRLTQETKRLEAQIAALPRPIPQPAADPRAELEAFTRANAIFFSVETTYRDEAATRDVLDRLANLMKRDPSLVRIVGYTDDVGGPAKNAALQKARADRVASELVARGVAPGRFVAIKRTTLDNVAVSLGSRSANRRVEFEVGFIGESAE